MAALSHGVWCVPHSPLFEQAPSRRSMRLVCCTKTSLQDRVVESSNELRWNISAPSTNTNPPKNQISVKPHCTGTLGILKSTEDSRRDILLGVSGALDSSGSTEKPVSEILIPIVGGLEDKDAVQILSNMSNPHAALIALGIFLEKLKPDRETVFFNATMKALKRCRNLEQTDNLFNEMIERGVQPDKITFTTMISTARLCNSPEKAMEWLESMPSHQCYPEALTYSIAMDAYGRTGNCTMLMEVYKRATEEGLIIDPKVFLMLINFHAVTGHTWKCKKVYDAMKALGLKPDLVAYNSILYSLERSKLPWHARTVYNDMISNGVEPDRTTYTTLLRVYGHARYPLSLLHAYKEMKEKGMQLDAVHYNTVVSVLASFYFTEEALRVFKDMNESEIKLDRWTASSMIVVYSKCGDLPGAEAVMDRLKAEGIDPDLFIMTAMIGCYGRARRSDKVASTIDQVIELGMDVDERFSCSVLGAMSVIGRKGGDEELCRITGCLGKVHPELAGVLNVMVEGREEDHFVLNREVCQFLESVSEKMKAVYCNCFVDLCEGIGARASALRILDAGVGMGIYGTVIVKGADRWSLHLRLLSVGAGLVALDSWVERCLLRSLGDGEEFPPALDIQMTDRRVINFAMKTAVQSRLKEIGSPFRDDPDRVGWMTSTGASLVSWLESLRLRSSVS